MVVPWLRPMPWVLGAVLSLVLVVSPLIVAGDIGSDGLEQVETWLILSAVGGFAIVLAARRLNPVAVVLALLAASAFAVLGTAEVLDETTYIAGTSTVDGREPTDTAYLMAGLAAAAGLAAGIVAGGSFGLTLAAGLVALPTVAIILTSRPWDGLAMLAEDWELVAIVVAAMPVWAWLWAPIRMGVGILAALGFGIAGIVLAVDGDTFLRYSVPLVLALWATGDAVGSWSALRRGRAEPEPSDEADDEPEWVTGEAPAGISDTWVPS